MTDLAPTAPAAPARRTPNRALRRLRRRPLALAGAVVVTLFTVLALFAPLFAPYNPTATDFLAVRQAPSAAYLLGTDDVGRDVLSRVIFGARASLTAGVISVVIAFALGVPLGLAAGFYGGWLGEAVMRLTDAVLAFPFLILAIALAASLGPSLQNAMVAIGVASAPTFVRLTRGQVLSVKGEDYVQAARAVGGGDLRVVARHILPNTFSPLLIQASLTVAQAIIAESALSFLGLGVQPPTPSWGSMLNTAKGFMAEAPWMAVWPGLCIFVTVLAFNLFGDGLRDAFDPREEA